MADDYNYPTIEEYEADKHAVNTGHMTVNEFSDKYPAAVQRHFRETSFEKLVGDPPTRREINGMVQKYQEMDPRFEDFLFSGDDLENGMVVLAEPMMRRDISQALSPKEFYHARLFNRWFQISNLTIEHDTVTMQANYEDGTKARLDLGVGHSWYYKLGSDLARGTAQVLGQIPLDTDQVEKELKRLRKEDFGG